jgi:hypothetical protein
MKFSAILDISTGILYTDYFHFVDDSVIIKNRLVTSVFVGIDLLDEPIYVTKIINNYEKVIFYEK